MCINMEIGQSQPKVDKNILDLFWKLGLSDVNGRLKAVSAILFELLPTTRKAAKDRFSKDIQYCLERLVKGLSSSREAARIGYSVLLTEIIKHINIVEIEDVLELIKKHLCVVGKQDRRDFIFGQVFAYSSLVRSGRLVSDVKCPQIVTSLYELSCGRPFITKACYEIILDLFSQLSNNIFKENVWPALKKIMPCGWESCSPDQMWLLCLSYRLFPDVFNKYWKKYWESEDLFSSENYEHLKKIMKQTSSTLPLLHPLCFEFLNIVKERKDMVQIWNAVVDGNLYGSDKAYIAFELVKKMLEEAPKKKLVKIFLSAAFRTCFNKSFLNVNHPLHPAALHLAEFFCRFVKGNKVPEIQIIVLKAFLQPPGTLLADNIFKKKEVLLIIQSLSPEAIKMFCEILKTIVLSSKTSVGGENEVNNMKQCQAVYQLGNMVMNPAMIFDIEWRLDVIKFLLLHSFFTLSAPIPGILHCDTVYELPSNTLKNTCISSFYRAVHSLHLRTEKNFQNDFTKHLLVITDYAELLMNATPQVNATFPLDGVMEVLRKTKSFVSKLSRQSKKDGQLQESIAFQSFFLQLGLLLFEDPDGISNIISELYVCCKKALKSHKHAVDASEMEEPPWIEVVLDIILSLLSKPSNNLRQLVSSVFPLFCPFMNQETLQEIFDVINPPKDSENLMDVENEDDESETEFVSGSSSQENYSGDEELTEDAEFREKIQEALGPAAEDSETESVALSDSEMFRLDDALSKAFQSRMKKKHSQPSEDVELVHFRTRCFDLILLYLKTQPPMKMVLACIEPLLEAYSQHKRNHGPVRDRAVSILQFITKIRMFENLENVTENCLERLFNSVVFKCHKELDLTIAKKLYSLCVFIVLCFRRLDGNDGFTEKAPYYMKLYSTALDYFMTDGKSHLSPHFFTLLMSACPDLSWHFIDSLIAYAFDDKMRLFKKTQCLGLLSETLKYSKGQKEISVNKWIQLGHNMYPKIIKCLKNILQSSELKQLHLTELLSILSIVNSVIKEKSNMVFLLNYPELLNILNDDSLSKIKKTNKRCKSLLRSIVIALGGKISNSKFKKVSEADKTNDSTDVEEEGLSKSLDAKSENQPGDDAEKGSCHSKLGKRKLKEAVKDEDIVTRKSKHKRKINEQES